MLTSGGLGEIETAGLTMNIVPKQGGNSFSGLAFVSGYSEGMLADNYDDDLKARGVTAAGAVYRVYDFNVGVGGPIVKDKLWYYMSVREQGSRQNTLNTFYNKNAGNPNSFLYEADLDQAGVLRSHLGKLHAAHHLADQSAQQADGFLGRAAGLPQVQRHDVAHRLAELRLVRVARVGRPRRVQPAAHPAGEVDVAGHEQAAARSRLRHHLLRVGRQAARGHLHREPGADVEPLAGDHADLQHGHALPLAVLVEQQDARLAVQRAAAYITGSHSLKFGYQGAYWRDDREQHVNSQSLGYIGLSFPGVPFFPIQINEYINPFVVNARAMQASFFVQDSWTVNRLTLQGALRYDHPWSWFPEQTIPKQRFFPGATFAKADGVTGYNDITPRLGASYDLFGTARRRCESISQVPAGRQCEQPGLRVRIRRCASDGWRISTTGLCSSVSSASRIRCVSRPGPTTTST
jgi:hypothetical protein